MKELFVFIGFQFKSSHFRRTALEQTFVDAVKRAEADLNPSNPPTTRLRPILFDLESGAFVGTQILERIGKADICVFELSDLNPNVYFELGFAVGKSKPCIYLFNEGRPIADLPSDLSGIYVVRYDADTLGARLASELQRRAEALVEASVSNPEAEDAQTLTKFWGLQDRDSVCLVCPEIPVPNRIPYADIAQRDYLRLAKFADIDSLYHLKDFLARYFPQVTVRECTAEEVPADGLTGTLIVIGGIAWNRLNRQLTALLGVPWAQVDGGTGNDDPYVETVTNTTFLPILSDDHTLQQDTSLFVRAPNPANRKRRLFVASGIRTYGVLGAAKCFTTNSVGKSNCSLAFHRFGDDPCFGALFRSPVINGFVPAPDLGENGVLLGVAPYDPQRHIFGKVERTFGSSV